MRSSHESSSAAAISREKSSEALACVAVKLGNTPAICRKAYVHPAVLETYAQMKRLPCRNGQVPARRRIAALSHGERVALRFVRQWEHKEQAFG